MRALRDEVGFTLIEMMVVIALLAILASIAAPAMGDLVRRNAVDAASNELYGLLQYARGEAITRRQRVTISAGSSDDWSGALEVAAVQGSSSTTLRHYDSLTSAPIEAVAASQALDSLSFYSNGASSGATVITLCHSASASTTGKAIEISRTGQVTAPKDASCE